MTASGSVAVVTAGAKSLGPYGSPGTGMAKWLREKLKAWEALPEADRAPGAVVVPAAAAADPKRLALVPPPGALIVRVFNRHLGRGPDGALRYAVGEDYLPGASRADLERYAMAQNDFMWIPEKEWQALVPPDPKAGDRHAVPASFLLRLLRFHLDPARGFTEGANFTRSSSADGRLDLVVQEVSADTLRLALEGKAELSQPERGEPALYRPALRGRIEVDRARGTLTRFELLALGDASGLPRDANGKLAFRAGSYPVGIAFDLLTAPTPAERLHPRGARDHPAGYLEPKDKGKP